MSGKRAIAIGSVAALAGLVALVLARRHTFFVGRGGDGQLGFDESSGLVASPSHEGVFWTHPDSGAPPILFAVDETGAQLARVRVPDARNVDWEDIAADPHGNLWIADSGNNGNARRDLVVYRVSEPDLAAGASIDGPPVEAEIAARIPFRYAEQLEFPASVRNFDAESLFWARGRLYLLTKHRADSKTTLYRFPALDGRAEVVLERISEFDLGGADAQFGGMATGADFQPELGMLAVLSYHAVFLFQVPESGDDYLARPVHRIELNMNTLRQCEGIAWDGSDLLLTNESGRVFRIDDPLRARPERFAPD